MSTTKDHRVMLCLASNRRQKHYMEEARKRLEGVLGELRFTCEHWTEAAGGAGTNRSAGHTDGCTICTPPCEMYLNQLATGVTTLGIDDLNTQLKNIERLLDRKHDKSGIVTIDIDLLQYDDTRCHLRDWERSYVKDLLKEL